MNADYILVNRLSNISPKRVCNHFDTVKCNPFVAKEIMDLIDICFRHNYFQFKNYFIKN